MAEPFSSDLAQRNDSCSTIESAIQTSHKYLRNPAGPIVPAGSVVFPVIDQA
ncbi:MAG: hypothetical protein HQ517_08825 [SAR324 cluster bacterium]|nr:hypothetical protein [SAR324 cluster bacterium]